jgi:hypothetical protein
MEYDITKKLHQTVTRVLFWGGGGAWFGSNIFLEQNNFIKGFRDFIKYFKCMTIK